MQAFNQLGIDIEQLNVVIRLDATEAIKNFLRYTQGIAFVSERAIDKELQWNLLKKLDIKNVIVKRFLRIAQSPEPAFSYQQKFIDFLHNYNL
jgi:DNA-binding transcriptional LysR family regulator